MSQTVVDNLVECTVEIPLMPEVVRKVLDLIGDPRTEVEDLAEDIRMDPALTAKVMKMANSAFYWRARKISTLNMAILTLGYRALLGIVLASSTKFVFEQYDQVARKNRKKLWDHSISVALISGFISKEAGLKDPDTVFMAALLHDFGKLIVSQKFPYQFNEIIKAARTATYNDTNELEKKLLGFSHPDIGGLLIRKWKLPESIEHIVLNHHHPLGEETYLQEKVVVHLADLIASDLGWNYVQQDMNLPASESLLQIARLSLSSAAQLISTVHKQVPDIKKIF